MGICEASMPDTAGVAKKELKSVRINEVANGFIVNGSSYSFPRMIANTLAEALELARKELS